MMLSLRLAARELRAGLDGFRIFLACLAVGVAAIAAAGSTAEAFRHGLAADARGILGGDLAITVQQRTFTDAEARAMTRVGRVAVSVSAQAMAQAPSGARRLVELRGVDGSYPLVGAVSLAGGRRLAEVLTDADGAAGAAVEQSLLDSLHLKVGDRFLVGNAPIIARAVLISEPDRLSRGFALGPRVLTRKRGVAAAGFLEPGLPFAETARIAIRSDQDPRAASAALGRALTALGPGGYRIRDRNDAAPGFRRMIDELEYFLGFIGLVSLVAGGLGVSGAVSAYLARKTEAIAVLKTFGADGVLIRNIYLIQIGALACVGIALGLIVGAVAPLILAELIEARLPVPALFAIYPAPLLRAGVFGILAAATFSLAPLGAARATPPSLLFRGGVTRRSLAGVETLGAIIAACGLAGLAIATAPMPLSAVAMIAGLGVAFGGLAAAARMAVFGAGRMRDRFHGFVRIGVANLAGPGSAAGSAGPAIGIGIAVVSAILLIQSSLLSQLAAVAPKTAPALVFTAIPGQSAERFDLVLAKALARPLTRANYLRAPFVTGRIVSVRGLPIDTRRIGREDRWAYDNDIPMSAMGAEPINAGLIGGRWWPADYSGAPLAAVSTDAAKGARLRLGDPITLMILGRTIDARVAAIRSVDFAGFGANFAVILDAAALTGANLDEVAMARGTPAETRRATLAVGREFPRVNVIDVREQLTAAAALLDQIGLAISGVASIAAVAGVLVLIGAVSARAGARARDVAILKALGATSRQIVGVYGVEYGAVGLFAGLAGVALGYAAAWPVVVLVFRATWRFDWTGVLALAATSTALAVASGLLAAAQALARRPAAALKTP